MTYKFSKAKVDEIAHKHNYSCIDFQENIGMVSYSNGNVRINIYLTKMTVATCMNHPKKGQTQLFRRDVDLKTLNDLFSNPRKHTGKGYYKK